MATKTKENSKQKKLQDLNNKPKKKTSRLLLWMIFGVIGLLLVAAVIVVVNVLQNKLHDDAITKYAQAWFDYAEAQQSFGREFGVILGEMGYTIDGSGVYDINYDDQYEICKLCAKKVGIYDDVYNNPYAVKDDRISEKDTASILKAADSLMRYAERINSAKNFVGDCREIGENKKNEINSEIEKKKAEEIAKAEEEAAKKKREEERAAREKYALNYDKFINKINEGMTLEAVKEVYGGFDDQCKIGSQSSGFVIYSCESPSNYDYWVVSFSFYNGVLQSKAQSGLK